MRRILILFGSLLLLGCMQSKNIDEYAYVLNIGVERGTTMPYLVTFVVSVPGGTEEMTVKNAVISAEARSFPEAYETLNASYPSRLSFSRASLLVIGEDLARTGEQEAFLDFAFGKPDLWQNLRVVVAKPPIWDVLTGWLSDADPSLRKIKTAVGDLSARSGLTADAGYSAYLEATQGDRFDAMLAYAGVNEYGLAEDLLGGEAYPYVGGSMLTESMLKTSTAGSAVFDGTKMVGVLDGRHTMEVMMVTDAFRRGELSFTTDEGQEIRVTLYRMHAPKIRLSKGRAEVLISLEADPYLPESVPMEDAALRAFLEERIKAELSDVFSALRSAHSDAMGFGRFAAQEFSTVSEWERYDWKTAYRTLQVDFSVRVMLSHHPSDPGTE